MQPVTDPAVSAFVLGLVVFAGIGIVSWLLSRQVKAYDERMQQGAQKMAELTKGMLDARESIIELKMRMQKAEGEIANDKQGRAAFVQMQHDLGRVLEALAHLAKNVDELFDRLNSITDQPLSKRPRRPATAAE